MRSVDKFTQLDYFTERHLVADIELRSLNEFIVRLIRQIEDFAVDIDAVDKPAEIQEIEDLKRSFDFAKVKDNTGS
ncbi:hypothetical protein [Dyadobacter endophyticus]|uniref:hypothetical protein n=1 Tax=Dyadobacter endophyticus TaxID=1749036 RepID=UPI00166D4B92|nr:hypothetical protein [Dyadobacter endophyticus]